MKSTEKQLKNRGMASQEEIDTFSSLALEELRVKLHDKQPCVRGVAAINLGRVVDEAAGDLLQQLSIEKSLYTRIAICESLEKGNIQTALKMTEYLGEIGNNQYKELPDKVSAKKSFPLPRDIIARSLGRMDIANYSAITKVLESGNVKKVSEALDGIGYMVFYNPVLATKENCSNVIMTVSRYEGNQLILWKILLCLSAFSNKESIEYLHRFEKEESILGQEARRSLKILKAKQG